jgi:hypothetical protein
VVASTLDVLDGRPASVPSLALVLFAIALQGGFHLWIWLALFLGLLAMTAVGARARVLAALAWGGLMSLVRFAPALEFLTRRHPQDFFSGYPSAGTLLAGLAIVHPPDFPRLGGGYSTLNWWEYDAFVGWSGLALLVVLGVGAAFSRDPRLVPLRHRVLGLPMLALLVFSCGDLWAWMKRAGVPMLAVERVSSRFLLVPLVVLAVLACARLSALWDDVRARRAAAVLAVAMAGEMAWHARSWTLAEVERTMPRQVPDAQAPVVIVPFDGWHAGEPGFLYEETVLVAGAASAIALGAAGYALVRARRSLTAPAPGP